MSSSPFRTATAFSTRRRARPVVERAVFVIVSVGARRFGVPVEHVERVVRFAERSDLLRYADTDVPVRDLLPTLRGEAHTVATAQQRVLVMRSSRIGPGADAGMAYAALRVDAVHEVFAVETVLVRAVTEMADAPAHEAVRGVFTRFDHPVWVLDPQRLPELS